MQKAVGTDGHPVLLVSPGIRPHRAQLLTRFVPNLPVISQAEIPAEIKLETLSTAGIGNAG